MKKVFFAMMAAAMMVGCGNKTQQTAQNDAAEVEDSLTGAFTAYDMESIAFCCISTGVFHFPNEQAAKIAIETVKSYPRHALKTIVFNVFLDKDRDIYQRLL